MLLLLSLVVVGCDMITSRELNKPLYPTCEVHIMAAFAKRTRSNKRYGD